MAFKIIQSVRNELKLLNNSTESDVSGLVETSYNYVRQGLPKSVLKHYSQSLELNQNDVENIIQAIAFLLVEFFKCRISEEECIGQAEELDISTSTLSNIYKNYQKHAPDLSELLRDIKIDSAQFMDLQWRLESKISSRCLRHDVTPRVIIKLDLNRAGKSESVAMVSDIPNIIHFSRMVDEALAEGRTQNARKLQRILQ